MNDYQEVWLTAHPWRSRQWLRDKLADGFHIHHVDGDHANNAPLNLILIDGADHIGLHTGSLSAGVARWRKRLGTRPRKVTPLTEEVAATIDSEFAKTSDTLHCVRHLADTQGLSWSVAKRLVKLHLKRAA